MRFAHSGVLVATGSALLLLVMSGCTVGPNYTQPKAATPANWSVDNQGGIAAPTSESATSQEDAAHIATWWQMLNDSALNSLIEQALVSNYDLKIAQARVREARAQRGVVAAGLYPNVNVNGSYSRSRRSDNAFGGNSGGTSTVGGVPTGFGFPGQDVDFYDVGFDANWELDFFGHVRRSIEAANAEIQVADENRRDVLVTLVAEVARNYTDVRGFQRRLVIALENIQAQSETLKLSESRFRAGLVSELDVAQSKAQLAATKSQVPALESQLKQSMHALALLLGKEPTALEAELAEAGPIPGAPPRVPVGLPSDLLRRRADIRSAERQLAAATAQIGVATADLFPRFSLTGSFGFSAEDAAKLFNSGSRNYSIGPSVTWPIFDAGRIRSNIKVQDAKQEEALATYEQTVLISLGDVEDALVAFWKEQTRRELLSEAVDANSRAVELSNELYSRGLGDFLSVLESQRSMYLSQDQLVQSDQAVTANFIALYKALGGGWESFEPSPPESPPPPEGSPEASPESDSKSVASK